MLPKRFEKYGLETIHPEKTRLVPFERPNGDPTGTATEVRDPTRDLRPARLRTRCSGPRFRQGELGW